MYTLGYKKNSWKVSSDHVDMRRTSFQSKPLTLPAEPQDVTLDLNYSALIIVDMQNDFCSEGGWLSYIGADYETLRKPIKPINRLLKYLRSEDVPIIWLNWGNRKDRMNLSPSVLHVYNGDGEGRGIGDPLPEIHSRVLEKESWSAEIVEDLDISPSDIYVDKYRMSGFWDTPLNSILKNLNCNTVLFAGVNLDQCVMGTLEDAVNSGYDSILLKDCCATNSPDYCTDATLFNIKQCYGFVSESKHFLP